MGKHVLDLPELLLGLLVFPLLRMRDLCRLDTACTSRAHRRLLHLAFSFSSRQLDVSVDITAAKMRWLRARGFPISQLCLAFELGVDELKDVFQLLPLFPEVKSINFNSNTRVTDSLFQEGCAFLTNISQVDLSYCHHLTDTGVYYLCLNCPKLSKLNISCCRNVTKEVLGTLASKCGSQLSHLSISYLQGIDELSMKKFSNSCYLLTELNLSRCTEVTDSTLLIISEACPHILYLDVSNCRKIKDSGIIELAKRCGSLRCLNVRHCKSLTDKAMCAVGQGCPRLETLTVSYCVKLTDVAIIGIAKGCPELRRLNISYCGFITDHALHALAQHCESMEHLNISFCSYILRPDTVNFKKKVDISYKKFSQLAHWHNNFLLRTSAP